MADIELVIKIDEDYYEIIKHGVEDGSEYKPWTLIAHGTPLPKGHGNLCDENQVFASLVWGGFLKDDVKCGDITKILDGATIIEADNTCSTCTHSDETDGSNCYECVKGKSKYEADKESEVRNE